MYIANSEMCSTYRSVHNMYVRTYVCTICLCLCVSGETAMSEEMRRADFKEKQGILIRKVCLHTNWLLRGCDV